MLLAKPIRPCGNANGNGNAAHESGREIQIPLDKIADSPYQLRENHTEDLDGLKETLVTHGLLQAVVVRRQRYTKSRGVEHFELLAGHRRCAAARLAGWTTIRARIEDVDDATAEEIVVIENLQRKDLSAIAEARGFQAMLKHEGATQETLAARLGVSQGHIANRLRMLRLPDVWQAAIISGEIPSSYSRAILPYCEEPRVAAAVAALGKKMLGKKDREPIEYSDIERDLFRCFSKLGTQCHEHHNEHDKKTGRWLSLPAKLTDEQRRKLDIIEIRADNGYGREETERIAMNRSQWFEIAREHAAKQEARNAKREKKPDGNAETPAEKRAAAAWHAKKKKERQQQQAFRRQGIAEQWKRCVIGRAIADPERTSDFVVDVCLCLETSHWRLGDYGGLRDAVQEATGSRAELLDLFAAGSLDVAAFSQIARLRAARAFVKEDGDANPVVGGRELDLMIEGLKIDLAKEWKENQMADLSEAYWNAYDKEELVAIGGRAVNAAMTKAALVEALMNETLALPAELKPKSGKARRKPR